jgi:hypothetical protein
LIKNTAQVPEISTVAQFIAPRQALVNSGELTRFKEWELSETTQIFGNIAHRYSVYGKAGTQGGKAFEARGVISTQFVKTPQGWKMSAMAWDDERPGLAIPADCSAAEPAQSHFGARLSGFTRRSLRSSAAMAAMSASVRRSCCAFMLLSRLARFVDDGITA